MKDEPKLDFGPTKKEHGWFYYVGTGKLMCSMRY